MKLSLRAGRGFPGFRTLGALALVSVAVMGGWSGVVQATSGQPALQPDHAWGGCTLSSTVGNSLTHALKAESSKFGTVKIDFIVIHTVALDNDGQPLTAGGHSGVILCTFPGTTAKATTETTLIPNGTDQPAATSVDILSNQLQSVLQYKVNGGTRNGKIEKRVCQTTDDNTDCWRVYK